MISQEASPSPPLARPIRMIEVDWATEDSNAELPLSIGSRIDSKCRRAPQERARCACRTPAVTERRCQARLPRPGGKARVPVLVEIPDAGQREDLETRNVAAQAQALAPDATKVAFSCLWLAEVFSHANLDRCLSAPMLLRLGEPRGAKFLHGRYASGELRRKYRFESAAARE